MATISMVKAEVPDSFVVHFDPWASSYLIYGILMSKCPNIKKNILLCMIPLKQYHMICWKFKFAY